VLHVGEFLVRGDVAVGVAAAFPGVIDIDGTKGKEVQKILRGESSIFFEDYV